MMFRAIPSDRRPHWPDGGQTGSNPDGKPAYRRTEMVEYGVAGARCFFDPSLRILCDAVAQHVVSVGLQSENHFRTINVQWIEQWGLFSRCGISQNQ
jgi:hypothetical protein